jgi:hypothetical protein
MAYTFSKSDFLPFAGNFGFTMGDSDTRYGYAPAGFQYTGGQDFGPLSQFGNTMKSDIARLLGNSNYQFVFDPLTGDLLSFSEKTGDNSGMKYGYTLAGDQYIPDAGTPITWEKKDFLNDYGYAWPLLGAGLSAAFAPTTAVTTGSTAGGSVIENFLGQSLLPGAATGGAPLASLGEAGMSMAAPGAFSGAFNPATSLGSILLGTGLDQVSKLINPNPSGQPGGQQMQPGILDMLIRAFDAYNKNSTGQKYIEWADKIFGQSAPFEQQLMNTFTNPSGWLEGPEGQALNRITQNQLLRTDSKAGNLSNDTSRSQLLQDYMMQGLNNYRDKLQQGASLGRNASAVALGAMGQGNRMMDSFYTPFTYGAGQQGGQSPVSGIINDIRAIGGGIKDLWSWLDDMWG